MISIKDIREKDFSRQVRGYNTEEVEDFLDELAEQTEELVRENLKQVEEIKNLRAALEAANQAPAQAVPVAVVEAPVAVCESEPVEAQAIEASAAINEPQYFKNLELTLRDTLISAQKIADETVAEARKKANQMIAAAEEKAAAITSAAKVEVESVRAESEEMKKAAEDYRTKFLRLVEDQVRVLKADDSLFQDAE